jgi:hypothetical protein
LLAKDPFPPLSEVFGFPIVGSGEDYSKHPWKLQELLLRLLHLLLK